MRTAAAFSVAIALIFPVVLLAVDSSEQSTKSPAAKYPVTYNISNLPVWRNKGKAAPEIAPELLTKYLRSTIEPQSWTSGAEIRPLGRQALLVISQTDANHKKVSEAINSFRQDNRREFREDAGTTPPINVGDFVPTLRRGQDSTR
jgi:hypothetical protein